MSIPLSEFAKIIESGTKYIPAWKHYNRQTTVNCDRCKRSGISVAYGMPGENVDLCAECYMLVEYTIKNGPIADFGGSIDDVHPGMITRMRINYPRDEIRTLMMTSSNFPDSEPYPVINPIPKPPTSHPTSRPTREILTKMRVNSNYTRKDDKKR